MLFLVSMEASVEVTFRNMTALPDIEALVRHEGAKLERYGRNLISCRVAIEQPQRHQRVGSRYRVRLYIGAGLPKPIVVTREPHDSDMHDDLRTIVLGAFRAARRQLQSETERFRGERKTPHEPRALVARVVPADNGYGFLRTLDGREIYFHRNSVRHRDFDRLTVGTEVRFEEEDGDNGPQASTVQIVGKPGARLPNPEPVAGAPPRGGPGAGERHGRRRRRGAAA
jgi:cold shock CspA family protein